MKIPIAMHKNLITGIIIFEYAEIEEKSLIAFFESEIKKELKYE